MSVTAKYQLKTFLFVILWQWRFVYVCAYLRLKTFLLTYLLNLYMLRWYRSVMWGINNRWRQLQDGVVDV